MSGAQINLTIDKIEGSNEMCILYMHALYYKCFNDPLHVYQLSQCVCIHYGNQILSTHVYNLILIYGNTIKIGNQNQF